MLVTRTFELEGDVDMFATVGFPTGWSVDASSVSLQNRVSQSPRSFQNWFSLITRWWKSQAWLNIWLNSLSTTHATCPVFETCCLIRVISGMGSGSTCIHGSNHEALPGRSLFRNSKWFSKLISK